MPVTTDHVVETISMVTQQHLDIRTITLGLSLYGCVDHDVEVVAN